MHYSPILMHIPDGFLSLVTSAFCWVITIALDGIAIARTRKSLGERQVPLMGIMAAFIFAAQMINFPVAGGTSGHLLGGALAAIMLGPWAAMLVMTSVIAVQGLLFQDGGLTVMGANILNMGLLTSIIGYGLYRAMLGRNQKLRLAIAGIAAWLSVMAGALLTSLELWLSGNAKLNIVIPAMLGVHALIGLGEGSASAQGGRGWIIAGILVALAVILLSPLASVNPDGLNRVAIDLGFIGAAHAGRGPLAGYTLAGLGKTPLSRIAAGSIGMLVVLALAFLAGRSLQKRS